MKRPFRITYRSGYFLLGSYDCIRFLHQVQGAKKVIFTACHWGLHVLAQSHFNYRPKKIFGERWLQFVVLSESPSPHQKKNFICP